MELDDLKTAWRELERRLDSSDALTVQLLRENRLQQTRSTLRWLALGQGVQAMIWIAGAAIAGPFWIEHRATPHLLVAGLVMHAYAIAAIVLSVRQLLQIATVDYAAPVIELQEHLACLRRTRLHSQMWLGLPWWLLWVVATMVGAKRLFSVDIYAPAPAWIHLCLAIGVVGMALTLWLPRIIGGSPRGSRFIARMLDDLAGRSLVQARRQLDEIARFGRE